MRCVRLSTNSNVNENGLGKVLICFGLRCRRSTVTTSGSKSVNVVYITFESRLRDCQSCEVISQNVEIVSRIFDSFGIMRYSAKVCLCKSKWDTKSK